MQITCSTSIVYHVQSVVCHLARRGCPATKFDRVEIAFILALSGRGALWTWGRGGGGEGGEGGGGGRRGSHIVKQQIRNDYGQCAMTMKETWSYTT